METFLSRGIIVKLAELIMAVNIQTIVSTCFWLYETLFYGYKLVELRSVSMFNEYR